MNKTYAVHLAKLASVTLPSQEKRALIDGKKILALLGDASSEARTRGEAIWKSLNDSGAIYPVAGALGGGALGYARELLKPKEDRRSLRGALTGAALGGVAGSAIPLWQMADQKNFKGPDKGTGTQPIIEDFGSEVERRAALIQAYPDPVERAKVLSQLERGFSRSQLFATKYTPGISYGAAGGGTLGAALGWLSKRPKTTLTRGPGFGGLPSVTTNRFIRARGARAGLGALAGGLLGDLIEQGIPAWYRDKHPTLAVPGLSEAGPTGWRSIADMATFRGAK